MTYWSSLSEGLFFWKEDIEKVPEIKFAPMSPNVSLMFNSKTKTSFVIDDFKFGGGQDSTGKYGYDVFYTFAVLYLDLLNQVRIEGYLSRDGFIKIKNDLAKWFRGIYLDMDVLGNNGNYVLKDIKQDLSVYYTKDEYYRMILYTRFFLLPKHYFFVLAVKILKPIFSIFARKKTA